MNVRLSVFFLICMLALAPISRAEDDDDPKHDTYELLNLFGDVFERVRDDYVEEATDEKLIEAAINGMLTDLDPHSSYLNAQRYQEMRVQTQGSFGGLGIEVSMEGGVVKVVSPIDDTPAFDAGIEPGDLITHLNGEEVLGMTLSEAVEKMRGPVGTQIDLTIRREGVDPFDVTLTRAIIKIRSVRSQLFDDIGYIRVSSFSEQTEMGIGEAIADLEKEADGALQGLVLDMRNNPGGLLSQAVAVSDMFLDQGEIVSTRSRKKEDTQRFNARQGDLAKGLPIVVLINGGSASASEIVAGALQDHRRAILLGTKSFGKGSVQTIIPLPGHGAMRLTTARYYTPSGRSIQAVGIEPDIVVEQARIETLAMRQRQRESDLRGALTGETPSVDKTTDETSNDAPNSGDTPANGEASGAPRQPGEDYQLLRALDLIRGLSLYQDRVATTRQ